MTSAGRVTGEASNQQTFNWGRAAAKATVLTGAALAALYALSQIWPTTNEETQETGSSLVLRSVGQLTAEKIFDSLAILGLPFVLGAPVPNIDVIAHEERAIEFQMGAAEGPTMQNVIDLYLKDGIYLNVFDEQESSGLNEVDYYSRQAELMHHPADRAVFYAIAKRFARDDAKQEFYVKEAEAGFAAASSAKTSEEELQWLVRAGRSLDIFVQGGYPYQSERDVLGFYGWFPEKTRSILIQQQLDLGAKIWRRAGELLISQEMPYDILRYTSIGNNELHLKEVLAARCFHLSGNALSYTDKVRAKVMYQKAYATLKGIDSTSFSAWEANLLQREIADVTKDWDPEIAFLEKKRSASSYEKLLESMPGAEFELKMKLATMLFNAGVYAQVSERLVFYTRARDIFEELWEKDAHQCERMNLFYIDWQAFPTFEQSWLYNLRVFVDDYQKKLDEKIS